MLRHPIAREVAVIVAIKIVVLIAAAMFVFGPNQRRVIDAAAVEALLALPSTTAPTGKESRR